MITRSWKQGVTFLPFLLIPALGAVAPFVVIPAITSNYGKEGWACVAVAQSLGSAAAIAAELGWAVVGPQRIATLSTIESRQYYALSLITKLMATACISPLVAVLAFSLAQYYKPEAALAGIAFTCLALSPSWYFIGKNQPLLVLVYETIPRMSLALLCAVAFIFGAPFWVYGATMMISALVPPLLATRFAIRSDFRSITLDALKNAVSSQFVIMVGRSASVAYTALPITLVALVKPNIVPVFSACERLMRMTLTLLVGVPSRLQSWLGAVADSEHLWERSRRCIQINLILGVASGTIFAIGAPLASKILFSGTIAIPYNISFLAGLVIVAICSSRGLGLVLVAHHRANVITVQTMFAAAVGSIAILILTVAVGLPGPFLGELLAEVVGITVQGRSVGQFAREHQASQSVTV